MRPEDNICLPLYRGLLSYTGFWLESVDFFWQKTLSLDSTEFPRIRTHEEGRLRQEEITRLYSNLQYTQSIYNTTKHMPAC